MPTLRDIAEQAGVSTATVSTALSGRRGTTVVSAKTEAQIRRIAREIGYRPNPHATSLRTGKTGMIGVYVSQPQLYLAHPQGANRFAYMCDIASRCGYQITLIFPDRGRIDERLIDGCLVMDPATPAGSARLAELAGQIPVLSISQDLPGAIEVQHDKSWNVCRRRAASYLYELGHRRIAVVHDHEGSQVDLPVQFLEEAGELGLSVDIVPFPEQSLDRRYLTIDEILLLDPMPTAVFAIDDEYARCLISRLSAKSLRVPDDVSVFSGSTTTQADGWAPRLSGLVLRDDQQTESLLREFFAIIEGKRMASVIAPPRIEVDFIERDSCAPPPKD